MTNVIQFPGEAVGDHVEIILEDERFSVWIRRPSLDRFNAAIIAAADLPVRCAGSRYSASAAVFLAQQASHEFSLPVVDKTGGRLDFAVITDAPEVDELAAILRRRMPSVEEIAGSDDPLRPVECIPVSWLHLLLQRIDILNRSLYLAEREQPCDGTA